jgi:hypothetical protein
MSTGAPSLDHHQGILQVVNRRRKTGPASSLSMFSFSKPLHHQGPVCRGCGRHGRRLDTVAQIIQTTVVGDLQTANLSRLSPTSRGKAQNFDLHLTTFQRAPKHPENRGNRNGRPRMDRNYPATTSRCLQIQVLFDFKAHGVVGLPQSAQGGPHPECLLLGQTTSFGFAACLKARVNYCTTATRRPPRFQLLIR